MPSNINLRQIKTDNDLAAMLKSLGFESQKNLWVNSVLCERDLSDQPQRIIFAQDNGLESHSVVILDNGALIIYYYDEGDDLFKEWTQFSEEVNSNIISDNLRSVMTLEGLKKRFSKK